jgi:2TM family of unknown function (DUF5676)
MWLNPNKTGLALGATLVIVYAICGLLSAVWPQFIFGIATTIAHSLTLTPGTPITAGSFLYGVLSFAVVGYVTGAIFAFAWNISRPATLRKL